MQFSEHFCQNRSLSFPLRIAVFCSIRSPSMSQRKLWGSSNRSSAFQNTQDDLLECLYTHKVKVLGYNEVLILNECFIRPPKEEI